jgi:N-acetylglutamate synthase-like GNAT family acetyltransferase
MKIRKATLKDFDVLYALGLKTPELRVSATEPFMDRDDFSSRIADKNSVFLLAEEGNKIAGFICANAKDSDRPIKNKYACIVYIAVLPAYRKRGIATKLYNECIKRLKFMGITHVYTWADATSSPVQKFFLRNNFAQGKPSIWMDRKL